MSDDTEIALQQRAVAGGDVFPETESEIDRLEARLAQSELIVAASEKQHPETSWLRGPGLMTERFRQS
jgi:hypothetical protein